MERGLATFDIDRDVGILTAGSGPIETGFVEGPFGPGTASHREGAGPASPPASYLRLPVCPSE